MFQKLSSVGSNFYHNSIQLINVSVLKLPMKYIREIENKD